MNEIWKVIVLLLVTGTGITAFYQLQHGVASTQFRKTSQQLTQNEFPRHDPANISTLQLVQVLFRHGARTPLGTYPNDPNKDFDYGVKGYGQLTPKGLRMAGKLGTYLRYRYDGYFSSAYSYDQVYVQSSDTDRTIMTGQMCLNGLFPTTYVSEKSELENLHPIPLRTIALTEDNKLLYGWKCPRENKLFAQYLRRPRMQRILTQHKWIFEVIRQNTGWKKVGFQEAVDIADILQVQEENGATLPNWVGTIYPEPLLTLTNIQFTYDTATPPLRRLHIGPFVAQLVQNMELRVRRTLAPTWSAGDLQHYHNRTAKGYLYAGHDTAISPFLNSFGLYDGIPPRYTAAIILELHSLLPESMNEKDYTVKLFYRNKRSDPIMNLNFPKCPDPCTLKEFKQIYQQFIVGDGEWHKECHSPP